MTLFWHAGLSATSRTPWGRVLEFHRQGIRSRVGLRRRDHGGLSPRGLATLRAEGVAWWAARMRERTRRARQRERAQQQELVQRHDYLGRATK